MKLRTSLVVLALLSTTACVPAVVAGGAYGVSSATSERGLGGTFSDIEVQTKINGKWFNQDADMTKRLDLTVTEGRVLITGQARDQQQKLESSRLAWEVEGVKEVINEAEVQGSTSIGTYAKDMWISTKLRTYLTFDGDIAGRNYTIDTVKGVVYLMGYARNANELSRVTTHASTISGVTRVVSYARVGNQPEPVGGSTSPSSPAPVSNESVTAAPARSGALTMEPIPAPPGAY